MFEGSRHPKPGFLTCQHTDSCSRLRVLSGLVAGGGRGAEVGPLSLLEPEDSLSALVTVRLIRPLAVTSRKLS